MSRVGGSFVDLYVRGEALAQDIDDFVARWHDADAGSPAAAMSLAAYLGLDDAEYAAWVEDPDVLPDIMNARLQGAPRRAALRDGD